MKIILCDFDGTLGDITHRLHYIKGETKNWNAFHLACCADQPKDQIIAIMQALSYAGFEILIVSGRNDSVRAQSEAWLKKHDVPYDKLIMRAEGDHTPDDILKEKWLNDGLLGDKADIMCVFDDRQRVVDMWRRNGLTCLQVEAWAE